jgi:Sulfatase
MHHPTDYFLSKVTFGSRATVAGDSAISVRVAGHHARTRGQLMADVVVMAVAYLVLPNLPLVLLQHKLTLVPHGYINLECLLVGVGSLFLSRSIVFVLLFAEIVGSFVYAICYSFQFTLGELLTSARFTGDLPVERKVELACAVLLISATAGVVAFAVPRPRYRVASAGCLLGLIVLLSAVDVMDGQNPRYPRDVSSVGQRLTMSPWLTLGVRGEFSSSVDSRSLDARNTMMGSASAGAMRFIDSFPQAQEPNVVLILTESWGLLLDPKLADELTKPYDDARIAARYNVIHGTAPFDGLTIPGEARELCQSHLGFGILRISGTERENCLPEILHARGYESYAVHGYVGAMFQRDDWYTSIGFDHKVFEPELEKMGLPQCRGAFPGICDGAVPGWIGTHLLSGDPNTPKFVYWVTLNSHIPVPAEPNLPADGTCASEPALSSSNALCSWFRLILAVHQSVQQLALQPGARPTTFVLVGDHAPPFSNPRLRERFSGTVVPYVILAPKMAPSSGRALDYASAGHPAARTAPRKRTPAPVESKALGGN